jgi:hypothetical protein
VVVHRVAGRFGPAGLATLDLELNRFPRPRTVVIQYAPHAFGWKAMNVPFAMWAASRRARGDDLRVTFHEVAFPWVRRPLRHNLIAAVNRLMAAILTAAATRVYVSIPGWLPLLRGLGRKPARWTPIPSTIPDDPPPERVLARRREVTAGRPGAAVVGHFGTYGETITTLLCSRPARCRPTRSPNTCGRATSCSSRTRTGRAPGGRRSWPRSPTACPW